MKKLCIIILLLIPVKLFSQVDSLKEFNTGIILGVLPLDNTKLISNLTYGVEAEYLFGLSKSVKLGLGISYNRANGKGAQQSFSFVPLSVVTKWYPAILFNKLTGDKGEDINIKNLYVKAEIGHSFSRYKSDVLSYNSVGIGYHFKLSNNQLIDISISPNRKSIFSTISLKYGF
jgi:hypothetical protein